MSSGAPAVSDGRRARGLRTREGILVEAVDLASLEGLESLTIGRLADRTSVSKSGLFAHFKSKEGLQLATVDAAAEIFTREVIFPARDLPAGIERLRAALDAWVDYLRRDVFPGGCFFQAASLEFDSRGGPVRDRVAGAMRSWLEWLEKLAEDVSWPDGTDVGQVAFELNAIGLAANWQRQLLADDTALDRAEAAFARVLTGAK